MFISPPSSFALIFYNGSGHSLYHRGPYLSAKLTFVLFFCATKGYAATCAYFRAGETLTNKRELPLVGPIIIGATVVGQFFGALVSMFANRPIIDFLKLEFGYTTSSYPGEDLKHPGLPFVNNALRSS